MTSEFNVSHLYLMRLAHGSYLKLNRYAMLSGSDTTQKNLLFIHFYFIKHLYI